MTPASIVSVAASLLSLGVSIWFFAANSSAQGLQGELKKHQQAIQEQQQAVQTQELALRAQQDKINTGTQVDQQVGPQLVQTIGQLAIQKKNGRLRDLLSKHGITVNQSTPAPGATPAASPAPANNP